MQTLLHYFLHFIFPMIVARLFFKKNWKQVYFIFLATMLVDLDHLLANPIFQADRCSLGFHPFHSLYAIIIYCLLLFLKKPYRIIGIGLLMHMATDGIDCLMMHQDCLDCL